MVSSGLYEFLRFHVTYLPVIFDLSVVFQSSFLVLEVHHIMQMNLSRITTRHKITAEKCHVDSVRHAVDSVVKYAIKHARARN